MNHSMGFKLYLGSCHLGGAQHTMAVLSGRGFGDRVIGEQDESPTSAKHVSESSRFYISYADPT